MATFKSWESLRELLDNTTRLGTQRVKVLGKVQTDLCFEKPKFHLKI